jgi:hypothetical protein
MKTKLFLFVSLFISAIAVAGPSVSGSPENLPVYRCASGNRGLAIYQTNFATGNPQTDRFAGTYFDSGTAPMLKQELDSCQRTNGQSVIWTCHSTNPQEGFKMARVVTTSAGSVELQYFTHDPVESLGAPDAVIECE